jgi:hypothetical protein
MPAVKGTLAIPCPDDCNTAVAASMSHPPRHGHRSALPDALTRALQQAARAIRKHYRIRTRSQADRAGKLFARALFPRRAGRPRRRDVTRALQLAAQGLSRKDIYRLLGKTTPVEQHALRESMRLRRFRQRRRAVSNRAPATPTN